MSDDSVMEARLASLGERVAKVETRSDAYDKAVESINLKLDGILGQLSSISGGKKALWGLWAIVGTLLMAAIGVGSLIYNIYNHRP